MRTVTLFLCGDVMIGRGVDQLSPTPSAPRLFESYVQDARDYITLAERKSGPIPRPVSLEYIWGDALGELARAAPSARIVNLETSITRSEGALRWKDIHYRMHPSNVGCLTKAGIDVCVLANNHVLDWGEAGLIETLHVLRASGIRTAGAGRTAEEAERPAILELDADERARSRVLVLGLGHGSSGIPRAWAATPAHAGVALLGELSDHAAALLGERIRRERAPGDLVVASIHWGSNWGYRVPDEHVRFAHALVEQGVDVVHGHSSHHARPIELHRGRLILYGCGDFINDYEGILGYEAFRGELAPMYFSEHDGSTGELVGLRIVPLRMRRMRLERATPEEVSWLGRRLAEISPGLVVVHAGRADLAIAIPGHD